MGQNLISLLAGCACLVLIIAIILISICKAKRTNKLAKEFLEGLSDKLLVSIVEIVKGFSIKEFNTLEEFEIAVLNKIYDDTWDYTETKLKDELGAEHITVKVFNSIDKEKFIKFIDVMIEQENVKALIENSFGSYKIENSNVEEEDKALTEKFSNEEEYIEDSSNIELSPVENEEHTEEEIKALNPQTDEEEKFDAEDNSMEEVKKVEILKTEDRNGNPIYYEVSEDGKKRRVSKKYAEEHM